MRRGPTIGLVAFAITTLSAGVAGATPNHGWYAAAEIGATATVGLRYRF